MTDRYENIHRALAHEVWAAAQLAPSEGIADGVSRVEVLLRKAVHPAITHCEECGCDWLDNGLNPVGCPYCKQSADAKILVAERDELEAENEALRKEVEGWMSCAESQAALHDEAEDCAERLAEALAGLITWIPSADTYRRLGFDPEAPMWALAKARRALGTMGGLSND